MRASLATFRLSQTKISENWQELPKPSSTWQSKKDEDPSFLRTPDLEHDNEDVNGCTTALHLAVALPNDDGDEDENTEREGATYDKLDKTNEIVVKMVMIHSCNRLGILGP